MRRMESKHQIFLGEKCNTTMFICHDFPYSNSEVLYPIRGSQVKAFPKSTYDDVTVSAISEALKHSLERPTGTRFSVSLLVKCPHPRIEIPRVSANINLDEKLRSELANILFKPKLFITGVCGISRTPRVSEFESFQISDIDMSASSQTIENFTGVLKMQEVMHASLIQRNGITFNFTYSIILEWESIHIKRKRVKVLDRLYNDRLLTDCSIIPSNLNAVPCHRNVLSVTSDVLYAMLISGMEESQTNQIPMKHVSEDGVNALLAYIYEQEMKMESLKTETVIELFKAAHEYNIPALEDETVELLNKKQAECFELCAALDLYFFAVNVEGCDRLCKKMLQIFKRNPSKLRSSTVFEELDQSDHKKATDLLFKVLELESID